MYKIVVGNSSAKWQADWFCGDDNPYSICQGDYLITEICYVDAWCFADKYLRDHVDVDWGSFAWRANRDELEQLFTTLRWDTARLHILEHNKDYAVVFIESAGEF